MKAKLTIPESLNEISLKQYQRFLNVAEPQGGEFMKQLMVETFCGVKLSHVLTIKMHEVNSVCDHLNGLFEQDKLADLKLIQRFKIKGVEFGMIPDLNDISLGEHVDLDKYITDWDTMAQAMAVLYRPITHTHKDQYEIRKYNGSEEFADLMQFMPLDVVFSAMVFFWNLGQELLIATQNYLTEELLETIIPSKPSSKKRGGGTQVYTPLQKETLEPLIRSLTSDLQNALPFSLSKNKKETSNNEC